MQRRLALAAAMAGFASACTPLRLFDTLAPKDGGWRARRGLAFGAHPRQRLDVYRPAASQGPAPVVVFFYGGSWSSGRREDYSFVGAALASQGFVAVIPDYRLVPEVRFPAFVEDGAAAIAWASAHAAEHGGDPTRIVLAGHSAGAYIAAMLALDRRFLDAVKAPAGVVRGFAGLAGPYDFLPFDVEASRAAFGAFPDPRATQPVNFATSDDPPAFLATGRDDETVRPRNTEALAEALRRAGAPVETRLYDGVDHVAILLALSRPLRSRAPVLADLTAFVKAATA